MATGASMYLCLRIKRRSCLIDENTACRMYDSPSGDGIFHLNSDMYSSEQCRCLLSVELSKPSCYRSVSSDAEEQCWLSLTSISH